LLSWTEVFSDPAKAREAASAQIDAGADMIFCERYGAETACQQAGVYGIGNFIDTSAMGPDSIIALTLFLSHEQLMDIAEGIALRTDSDPLGEFENKEYLYGMKEGGSDFVYNPLLVSKVPKDVKDTVESHKQDILAGRIMIPNIEIRPEDYWGENL
jgi:basic membrane lipoprotein Med (substrate-binding protein (PBP1-ABC) superfamily)